MRPRRCAKGIKTRGTMAATDCRSTAATGAIAGRRVVAAVRERFVIAIRRMHASQSRRGSSSSKGHGSRVQVQVGAVGRVLHHLWCNDNMASSWRSTQVTSRSIRVGSRALRLTRAIQMSKIASGGSSSSSTRYKASVRVFQTTRLASEHDKEDSTNEGQQGKRSNRNTGNASAAQAGLGRSVRSARARVTSSSRERSATRSNGDNRSTNVGDSKRGWGCNGFCDRVGGSWNQHRLSCRRDYTAGWKICHGRHWRGSARLSDGF